jgi:HSP20 family protein
MSNVQWNPWRDFDDLFSRIAGAPGEQLERSEWVPPVDISESDTAYELELDLPAVAVDAVNVAVKDGVLTVGGERKFEQERSGKRHRVERRFGRFSRSFRLPEDIDEESIDASFRDGVLYLTITKKPKAQPRTIQVKVQ